MRVIGGNVPPRNSAGCRAGRQQKGTGLELRRCGIV